MFLRLCFRERESEANGVLKDMRQGEIQIIRDMCHMANELKLKKPQNSCGSKKKSSFKIYFYLFHSPYPLSLKNRYFSI